VLLRAFAIDAIVNAQLMAGAVVTAGPPSRETDPNCTPSIVAASTATTAANSTRRFTPSDSRTPARRLCARPISDFC
jgi:hypothetical protein